MIYLDNEVDGDAQVTLYWAFLVTWYWAVMLKGEWTHTRIEYYVNESYNCTIMLL